LILTKGYLLDTSVVSVLVPGREAFVPATSGKWLQAHLKELFLPCIAIAEMAQSIGKLRRAGGAERADRLDGWLDGLVAAYEDSILPLDAQAARLAGQISDSVIAQ
jgi:predicted nucleic acid-binding protein